MGFCLCREAWVLRNGEAATSGSPTFAHSLGTFTLGPPSGHHFPPTWEVIVFDPTYTHAMTNETQQASYSAELL